MKPRQTLRRKLGITTAIIISAVGICAFLISAADSFFHLRFKRAALASVLLRSAKEQNDLLVPTFLLPEQQRGQKLVMDRIVQEDELVDAKIIQNNQELPNGFLACHLNPAGSSCLGADRKTIATLSPLGEPDHIFGYLLKIKRIDSALSGEQSLYAAGSVALALLITFSLLIFRLSAITSRDVPSQLEALVAWVEAFLSNRHTKRAPELGFDELNRLGARIGELIEEHERVRVQAVVGQLASGVMHDIRTPLQSVVTALELVREAENGTNRLQRLESLYQICAVKIPIVGQIVETTLDGSRSIPVEKETDDLKSTLVNAISLQSDLAQRKNVGIELNMPSHPVMVPHDRAQMIRVFSNLVKNGIEATTEREGPRKLLISMPEKSELGTCVAVEDSGPGISGDPSRIFRAFQSKKRHGSGLGLLISRKIVEAHGGSLDVMPSGTLPGAKFLVKLSTNVENVEEVSV